LCSNQKYSNAYRFGSLSVFVEHFFHFYLVRLTALVLSVVDMTRRVCILRKSWDLDWLPPVSAMAPAALVLFARGLSDRDFRGGRVWHSLWHLAAGALAYAVVRLGLPLHSRRPP